ncbi:MATE efflux family protein [Elusimicrobium minutum Pei191]|uniref:Multidrug export protein MepA n=1 Tax=Elusimicrobium minutum (strain Pei191) TaxID=445932 RepID=B2KBD5_ELUMP|nr:MATE family efflux transporter [Elusimicrobium minutum]ACC97957.1 MATE efflux family protein [Elusimicrobium minutum Pei191]
MSVDTISSATEIVKEKNPFKGKTLQGILFKFSAPAVVGIIVNALYNVADRAFIGHAMGPDGIAAITISFPLILFIMACSIMIGVGGSVLFSISLGKKGYKLAERVLGNTFVLLFIVVSLVVGIWELSMDHMLKLLGASKAVAPLAKAYMRIILIGAPIQAVGMGMNNFLRAQGRPLLAMFTMLIGAVINCILGPLFIFYYQWGMEGAAWGVVLSQLVSAVWVCWHFVGKKARFKLKFKNFVLKAKIVSKTLTIGSSQFVLNTAVSVLNVILNLTLVGFGGDLAVSAMGIVSSVNTLIIMPVIGIGQGLQSIIGYYYGAKYYKRMLQFLKMGINWASGITLTGFIIVMLFAPYIVALFHRGTPELTHLASYALRVFNICIPLVGFQIVASTFFQATERAGKAIILTLSRQILLLIPLILILPRIFGLNGIFISGPVSDFATAVLSFVFLRREIKRYL